MTGVRTYCAVEQISHYVTEISPIFMPSNNKIIIHIFYLGGARGVMVIVVGNGLGDTSSNPGRD